MEVIFQCIWQLTINFCHGHRPTNAVHRRLGGYWGIYGTLCTSFVLSSLLKSACQIVCKFKLKFGGAQIQVGRYDMKGVCYCIWRTWVLNSGTQGCQWHGYKIPQSYRTYFVYTTLRLMYGWMMMEFLFCSLSLHPFSLPSSQLFDWLILIRLLLIIGKVVYIIIYYYSIGLQR